MEEEEYNTIKLENITSDEGNQNILRGLKHNDPTFDNLWICNEDDFVGNKRFNFCPTNGRELGWLGYYIGKSTTVDRIYINSAPSPSCNTGIEDFRRGLGRNNSIRSISFCNHRLDGQIFHMLDLFFKNTDNLTEFQAEECELGPEGIRQLSLALGNCKKSLKNVRFVCNQIIGGGQSMDIIAALHMHPQLKELNLGRMNIGRNECAALAELFYGILPNNCKH